MNFGKKLNLYKTAIKLMKLAESKKLITLLSEDMGLKRHLIEKKINKYLLLKQLICSPLTYQKRGDLFVFCQNSNALREALVFS